LFVFAGAGVSLSAPAGLPLFDWLRDEILCQLGLSRYTPPSAGATAPLSARRKVLVEVAGGLVPEPFMLALSEAGVDVQSWLSAVLSAGQPNAAHHALAQLAAAGARVWTVNFDRLIERASGGTLPAIAWPADPAPGAPLMKPHGSAGSELIVTARQVLAGLHPGWLERLRADVRGRTVVFVGYRGRDLDFQPVWDSVLRDAGDVLWFDKWCDGEMSEAEHKRLVARAADANGRLRLMPPVAPPGGAVRGAGPNPSWDFVAWCQQNLLADAHPDLVRQLFDRPAAVTYPALPGDTDWAAPAIQGLLGDYHGARGNYFRAALRPGSQRQAVSALATSYLNHGGNTMAAILTPVARWPGPGRLARAREVAERKRLTAWSRTGRHDAVLRATSRLPGDSLSTYLILRSEALRMTGLLGPAAETAQLARQRARTEQHPVRAAHAAFQECLALLWADRLPEVRACLDDYLRPYAPLAATRWVAWSDFIAGGLAVHTNDPEAALQCYLRAETRFQAEALLDGVVSVKTARLAAYRLRGEPDSYAAELARVTELSRGGERGLRYYTRRNAFTAESIDNDHAEFARCRGDLATAARLYGRTADSQHPLQAALGHLGLALIQSADGRFPSHAAVAAGIAEKLGNLAIVARSRDLLADPLPAGALRPVFFC